MILLNFSHPLLPDELLRLEMLAGQSMARVLDIRTHVDVQAELAPQVSALADSCRLSPTQWQTERLLVLPPALNFVAVTLLAELHGRMGFFPVHVRTRPVPDALPPRFEVAEIINLQGVRDQARGKR